MVPVLALIDREARKLFRTLEGSPEISKDQHEELVDAIYESSFKWTECEQIYEKCRDIYNTYMNFTVLPSLQAKHGEWFLRELVHRWNNHQLLVSWMVETFSWLPEGYVKGDDINDSLKDLGFKSFKEKVYQSIHAKAKVTSLVLQLIEEECEGEKIDSLLVKHVISTCEAIEIGFRNELEIKIIERTRTFYASKASKWINEGSCSAYLVEAEKWLLKRETVSQYLHFTDEESVVEIIRHELLMVHKSELLQNQHSGFPAMIRNGQVEDLSRMFRLFRVIPECRASFSLAFRQHVRAEGDTLVARAQNASKKQVLVRNIIKLHNKYRSLVIENLHNQYNYQALQAAFVEIFSGIPDMSKTLAIFIDDIMKKYPKEKEKEKKKKKKKKKEEEEVLTKEEQEWAEFKRKKMSRLQKLKANELREGTIDTVVRLLWCIEDRIIFAEVYRCRLAERLLLSEGDSLHFELSTVLKMRKAIGGGLTRKMEIMLDDMKASKEELSNSELCCAMNPGQPLENFFSVKVLTRSQWPIQYDGDLKLPKEMETWIASFSASYEEKWNHRELHWSHSMGTCILELKSGEKPEENYNLHVSTYQGLLLLLFNDAERLSLLDIKSQLGLSDAMLGVVIRSLTLGKYKILKKCPNTRTLEPNDTIGFNSEFRAEEKELKFPRHKLVHEKKVLQKSFSCRPSVIKAALVRVAKSRKVVPHGDIIKECIKLTEGFEPSIKEMKLQIEALIAEEVLKREYLEGEKDAMYHYLPE